MSDLHNAKKYAVRRKRHSIWRNIVTCIAAVVVFCTTYALILPAITMEYSCGKEEHVHVDGCYKLTCGLKQTPGHFHDETCYDEKDKLICGQEEPQSHRHTEACYAPADPTVPAGPICGLEETQGHTHDEITCYALPRVLSCGQQEAAAHAHDPAACYTQQSNLTCGQQESAGHTHADACYTQQTSIICGLEEGAEHTHTDACRAVSSVLTCALTESAGHAHTDACYTTTSVLTCTLAETAGHTHTDACYTLGDVPELICTQTETPGHTHTDACYPAASQPQLICGKEEVEVHKHTDDCYTLICVLEEHTHTNECQLKEEPTETTAPTDTSTPDETTAPTDTSTPDETTAPTDASTPSEGETQPSEGETQPSEGETQPSEGETQPSEGETQPSEGETQPSEGETQPSEGETQPSEGETQPSEGETQPSEGEILPGDEAIAGDEVSADGVTLMGAEDEITPLVEKEPKPFNEYVLNDAEHKPVSTTTNYDSANGKYETKIKFDFHITGAQLKATDGNFYIDINDEMIVPTDGGPFEIKNGDELTGYFRFETDPTTNKTKMVIEFLDDKVNALEDTDPVDGSMAFWGTANRNVEDDKGNLNINISNNIDVHVPSGEIKNDNVNINQYDLSVTKSAGNIVTTPPDMSKGPDALGTAKIQYTVNVISQKGTPDNIALTDNLNWTSGNPQNCTLTNVKVQKAPVSVSNGVATVGTPTGDVAITQPSPSAGDKNVNWAMNLPKLGPNEAYVVTYEYEYSFKADDAVTVESATNTAHATSKVPGGRPEERVDDEDSKTVDKITPPGPNPDLKKSGTEDTDTQKINWTVTFNEDRKQFGDGKDFTISDTMLSQADKDSLNVTLGGKTLTEGTDYKVENGKLVLINQQSSNDEIVITYTTPSDALNKWTPDGTVNTVENTASYQGHFGPVETTSTLTKEGGNVSKSVAGTVTKGDKLTIPWKVVITPGSDGIPANTVFTDTPENAFEQKVDLSSLQVYYADENGNPVTDGSGNPIPVGNYSQPAQAQNSNAVSFTFNEDPFAKKDLPANAKTVVVAYNTTTTGVPDYNKEFRNETEVGGKKDEAVYPYINEWVRPDKGGNVSVENDHLKIDWWVKFTTNKNVVTQITDSLKADDPGAHHYTAAPDKLTVWYKDNSGASVSAELSNGTDYSVIFRDAGGNEVAPGDAVSMEISFTQQGGYKLPGADNTERSLEFNYVTKTDAIPDVLTKYPNTVRAFDEEKTVEVPYDPNKLEKSVGTHTEDREKGIVTIPWTVKVTSESGKITTPITDSLKKQDGSNTKNHFFPANPNLVITVLDGTEANKVLTEGQDYTVSFYGDYSEPAEDGIGVAAEAGEGNTYMVIKLLPEKNYTIPGGGKILQLTYNTEAKTIDQGDPEYLDNKVWAVGKEATAQDRIDPPPAAPEDKVAGKIQQNGSGIRIPWTVYIKRGGAPLTQIEDQAYVDDWTYANHYLDVSTIHLEYLDENKQPFDASVPQPPTPEVKAYSGTYDNNFSPDLNTEGKAPVKYMKLLFDENGAFAGAPDEVQYLKVTYETYCPDVFAESAYSFMNRVKVSEIVKSDFVSIPKVEKTVEDSSGKWVKNPVDVGSTANGELKRWRIRAVTSAERESLTITDVLPNYVVLDDLTVKGGKSEYNLNEFKGLNSPGYNPADGSFSGAQDSWFMDPFPMTATGSCVKNADGRYEVSVTLNPGEGRKIPAGYVVDVYLTPRVDIASLPHNLQGKQFSLTNQAFVSHEAGGGPSNPSTQIWTDPRPDIADGTLRKGRYPLAGGVLNYVVTVNEGAQDLQPDGNSFVLIDTLTYNGSQYNLVPGTLDPADALKGYDIRLDTSSGKMVRFYKPDSDGRLETNADGTIKFGEELASSEWAVTVDTKTKVDGSTEKIIRARVPDNTRLLMLYTYRVEPRLVPANVNADNLAFEYDVSNTVYMYGHKDVEASEMGEKVTWAQQLGGGVTRTGNTFTVKKMDAANNAQLLGGAEFAVEVYDVAADSWTPVVRDSEHPDVKFVTNDKGALIIDTTEEWMQDPVKVEENKNKAPGEKKVDTLKYNTLYRMYEVAPPTGYILPDNPTVYYFYCSGDGEKLPDRLTRGATDLSLGSNLFWLENTSSKAGIHLEKIWMDHMGNVIPGTANQDFQLIQYKSQTNPSVSDANDPLLSTRKLKITVKGHSWETETKTAVFDTMKNTMMQLTVTNRNPDSNWAAISGTNAVFNPVIPGIRRTPIYQQGSDTVVEKIIFTFPATKVEETTISFNTNISNLDVSLAPLGRSAVLAASLNVAGEGQDLIKTGEEWTLTLTPGNGYKWSSDSFDTDPNQAGVQPLPFVEKDADGVTWYYTYVVKEINGSAAYTVSYSNMNSDGELVSMSSGTIQVVNTRLENPPISLPNTGGIGTTVFTLAGLALTGGAGLGLCKTKAKRRRGMSEKE